MSTLFRDPRWATDETGIVDPGAAKRAVGWVGGGEKPPFQTFNYTQNAVGEWANNYGQHAAIYDDLTPLARFLEEGERGILGGFYARAPFSIVSQTAPGANATTLRALEIGGLYVDPAATRDDPGDTVWWAVAGVGRSTTDSAEILGSDGSILSTLPLSNAPTTVVDVATNGTIVAVAYDTRVDIFDCSDPRAPVLLADPDHGGAVASVAVDRSQVYLAGAAGSGGAQARAYEFNDTASNWDYTHGATLNAIDSDGVFVYVGGNAGTGGATVRRLDRAAGTADWSNPSATVVAGGETFKTDGADLIGQGEIINPRVGDVVDPLSTGSVTAVELHPEYLFVGNGNLAGWVRRSAQVSANASSSVDLGATVRTIVSVGDSVWVGHDVSGGNILTILTMPEVKPRRFRRAAAGDVFQPYRRSFFPEGSM